MVSVDEGTRPSDGRGGDEALKDSDDDDLAGRGSDLRDGVGRGAETAGTVVVCRVLMRVCDRDGAAEKDERHAEHAEQKLPAARRRRFGAGQHFDLSIDQWGWSWELVRNKGDV